MMRTIHLLAPMLAGCMAPPDQADGGRPPAPVRPEVKLEQPADQPGVSYGGLNEVVGVGALTVRPLAVVEDSRCPVDVDCVWSGRLVIRAAVSGVSGEATISSIEPHRLPDGGTLEIASVWPPNVHGAEGPREPYRFGFRRR